MALVFTDEQIKELSARVLLGPTLIAQAEDTLAKAIQTKQDYAELDEQNAVFTTNSLNIVDQFHKEYKELTGVIKTLYNESNIDLAARLDPSNPHFPQPDWLYFYPKVLPSNTGLPTSNTTDLIEPDAITQIKDYLDLYKNGYVDGNIVAYSDGPVSGGVIPFDTDPGFEVGDRILLTYGTTGASMGIVTGTEYTPPPDPPPTLPGSYAVTYDVEFTVGTMGVNTTVQNFHPGFNNVQRESVTTNLYHIYLRSKVDETVDNWLNILNTIVPILAANDSKADKAEIDLETSEVNNAITVIINWKNAPSTGTNIGRYGDTGLSSLETEIIDRETHIPDRISQIEASLGTLTQNFSAKAAFEGAGRYYDYFKDLNARIHANDGTLRNFYGTDVLIDFTTQSKNNVLAEVARTKDILQIKLIAQDLVGDNIVYLENVSDLAIGQQIKFMDNKKPVLNYTIVGIVPEERKILLDGETPTNYSLFEQARIVRVL